MEKMTEEKEFTREDLLTFDTCNRDKFRKPTNDLVLERFTQKNLYIISTVMGLIFARTKDGKDTPLTQCFDWFNDATLFRSTIPEMPTFTVNEFIVIMSILSDSSVIIIQNGQVRASNW
jgi:hypothetical protein